MIDDTTLRADIIDGIVRTMIVVKNGVYDSTANPQFDKFDLRAAVAMALDMYANPNLRNRQLIEMMNLVESR